MSADRFGLRYLPVLVILLGLAAACSDEKTLGTADKARFRAELIDPRAQCDGFRERLRAPGISEQEIAAQYEEAKRAHCLRPEV